MEITIKAPKNINCSMEKWSAKYTVMGEGAARLVRIEARSSIDAVVSKIAENGVLGLQESYYISSPNFGVAIPAITSLEETFWITEQLINNGMPAPDAVTVAEVLKDLGDF